MSIKIEEHRFPGPLTQEECALRLGFSRARVSFIERQAIRKMKRAIAEDPVLRELFGGES